MNNFISQKFRFYSFISMLLLVYVHGYNLNNSYLQPFTIVQEPLRFTTYAEYLLANGLFRFRIPMLFIISGYLFAWHDSRPYPGRIIKRLKTLGIPYLFWSAFALLLTFVWQQFPVLADAVSRSQIDQLGDNRPYAAIGWAGIIRRWLLVPVAFQLWFIRSLLVYNLLYPLLKKAVTKIPKLWFPVTAFLWLTTFAVPFIESEGLLFFTLGIAVQKADFNIVKAPRWLNIKIWAPVFIISAVVKTYLAFQLEWSVTSFIILSLLHKLCVFSGLVTIWYGCDGIVKYAMGRKWFNWITAFAFMIYVLHVPLVNYTTQLVFYFYKTIPSLRLVTFIILPIFISGISIATGALLRKVSPKFYALVTGGRGMA